MFSGGPYHVFAGRECARALAVMRVARDECNAHLEDLDPRALQTLEDWVQKFNAKYPIVGQVRSLFNNRKLDFQSIYSKF